MPTPTVRVKLPKTMQWQLDFDYLEKLDKDALKFLSNFSNCYYRGSFNRFGKYASAGAWSPEDRRQSYGRKNSANRDVASLWVRIDLTLEDLTDDCDFYVPFYFGVKKSYVKHQL